MLHAGRYIITCLLHNNYLTVTFSKYKHVIDQTLCSASRFSCVLCLKQRKPGCLLGPQVQALVVELADDVPPQDVGVDLQQGAELQAQRGPPVGFGATGRRQRGGRGARGRAGRIG